MSRSNNISFSCSWLLHPLLSSRLFSPSLSKSEKPSRIWRWKWDRQSDRQERECDKYIKRPKVSILHIFSISIGLLRLVKCVHVTVFSTMSYPSKFFSALQSYCSRLSIVLLSYDSRSTLIRRDRKKNWSSKGPILLHVRTYVLKYDWCSFVKYSLETSF